MSRIETLAEYIVADTVYRYLIDRDTQQVGLVAFPLALRNALVTKRTGLKGLPYIDAMPDASDPPATELDPLVHLKIVGDWYPGAFSQGRTMRTSSSNARFRLASHNRITEADRVSVVTVLRSMEGLELTHRLGWHDGDSAVEITTTFRNDSSLPVTLEMLTSFSLGGITPFDPADAPGRLQVHRFRSVWSAEGRLESRSLEELHLERSWSGAGGFSERFGQIGSMPVRGFFPWIAATDTAANVTWGAQLAWAGSWQMEAFRQHDDLCLSGGLADREFGHWMKIVAPGEALTTPPATLACVNGGVDELADRLVAVQDRAVERQPAVEQDLPVIFNEWCTTWGDPRHDKVLAIADRLVGSGVRYLVIDAGWYKGERGHWGNAHGDWVPSATLFPHGLKATGDAIRARGLVPGLWFEMETVGSTSEAWHSKDMLLKRDGVLITVRERRFWDLNNDLAVAYLTQKVIGLLRDCGFGYLKVDYNETIGLGTDGAESQGEGLRRQIEGVHRFFDAIRVALPELVIENCSSGGHRLEPSMLARTAMSSFSDAHELVEIPIIAANLHSPMLPRQNQIWAVLHPGDSDRRLAYSLTSTFLGRMCLSGDVAALGAGQWQLVREAVDAYAQAAPLIKRGISRRVGAYGPSWRHPTGWQAVVRTNDACEALVVAHTFAAAPAEVKIELPTGRWQVVRVFPSPDGVRIEGRMLHWTTGGDFGGLTLQVRRVPQMTT
ncbi:MAG: alpha-galactosidase [Phycisphaerales bacterium]|nr:alpha-galactosidase [Phycisphaerales bacterium]